MGTDDHSGQVKEESWWYEEEGAVWLEGGEGREKHKHSSISADFLAGKNFIWSPPENYQLIEEHFHYPHLRVD